MAQATPSQVPVIVRQESNKTMSARKFVSVLALALSTLAPSLSFAGEATSSAAAPAEATPCLLGEYHVTAVSPYLAPDHIGKLTIPRVRGASVYVAAESGLTAEWLKLRIERHIADMRGGAMPGCALDVRDLRVDVDSTGDGFAVRLISSNAADGAKILSRARALVNG